MPKKKKNIILQVQNLKFTMGSKILPARPQREVKSNG